MQYFEEIYEFVEGSLEPEREMELFHALTADPELREKMKQLYAVKDAAKNSISKYQPTAKETLGVFTALNIPAPEHLVPEAAKSGFVSKVSGLVNKYRQGIIGATLATIIALLFMNFSNNEQSPELMAGKGFVKNNIPVVSSVEVDVVPANSDNSGIINTNNQTALAKKQNNYRIGAVYTKRNNEKHNIAAINNNDNNIKPATQDNANIITAEANTPSNPEILTMNTSDLADVPMGLESVEYNDSHLLPPSNIPVILQSEAPAAAGGGNFSLVTEVSGLTAFNGGQNIKDNGFTLNNASLTLLAPIGKGFFLGADIRNEGFTKQFMVPSGSGKLRPFDVQQNKTIYSLAARYTWDPDILKSMDLMQVTQVTLGLSDNSEFNFRGMVGLQYSLSSKLSLMAGVEYNGLLQNVSLSSYNYNASGLFNKFNLIYGMSYTLDF